jgi:hypothetical protein
MMEKPASYGFKATLFIKRRKGFFYRERGLVRGAELEE